MVRTIFSKEHRQHFPQGELWHGEFVTPFERPSRMEHVLRRLKERGFEDIIAPGRPDMKPVRKLRAYSITACRRSGLLLLHYTPQAA